jgi:DUF4097 and DUF4098 domain-containing protein YvlB
VRRLPDEPAEPGTKKRQERSMKVSFKYLGAVAFAFMVFLPAVAMAESSFSTVNKSIRINENSSAGKVDSVNGAIRIGSNSVVKSVESVNGSINLANDVRVEKGIEAVNGSVTLEPGCEVGGNVETVNGSIRLQNTSVSGDIDTVNGGIRLLKGTEVVGNVIVQKPNGWSFNKRRKPVEVEIGENVQVHGDLIFEHAVELKLHDSATVGEIIGDKVTINGS